MEEDKKYNESVKIIISVLISIILTACVTIFVYDKYLNNNKMIITQYESSNDITSSLNQLKTILEKNYKGDLDDDAMMEGALKGYVAGIGDEYTQYLTNSEFEELTTSLSDFVGIGVYLSELKSSKSVVVLGVTTDESPAAQAGIQAGDIIVKVDSEDVSDKGVTYVASKLKGPEWTNVKVTVLREEEEITLDIMRKRIKASEIKYDMLENKIGYIDFDSFTEDSYSEFKSAYEELIKNGAQSLIVDLRDNTGGYVNSALNIADMFVDQGKVLLITEDKDGKRDINYARTEKVVNVPVILLVNEYSASAAEILTGILKDYDIAKLVGTKTYGKGVIQNIIPNILNGALKVTTNEYFTPYENKINKIGIEPDIEVKLDVTTKNDNQLEKAIEILTKQ